MRIVFAGTPAVALPTLSALADSAHEVVGVVTRPEAARGRSRRPVPSEVGAWAQDHGIRVLTPQHPRDPDFQESLRELAPDVCPVVAYGALLPEAALAIPEHGWINLHFSLLPRWRGAAPVQHALMAGDEVTGATTFRIVWELDAGPVYDSIIQPLTGTETAGELLAILADRGAALMLRTLDQLGVVDPIPQPEGAATLAPKLTSASAQIDWRRTAIEIDRLVRGYSPAPGAWTRFGMDRFRLLLARPSSEDGLGPGEIRVEKKRVLVGTGTTALELLRVQPPGKGAMAAPDWGRGIRTDAPHFEPAEDD
ncbi:MAG: methionyl-tRNA formyltransferase [Propioniciclava sp.]